VKKCLEEKFHRFLNSEKWMEKNQKDKVFMTSVWATIEKTN